MDIQKLITFLPTTDLETTTRFYQVNFDLALFMDQGDCKIFKICENAYLGFCQREFEIIKGKILLTFIVEDVEKMHKYYSEKPNLIVSNITRNEKYNIIHFFITDPNGYLIEIQRFLEEITW